MARDETSSEKFSGTMDGLRLLDLAQWACLGRAGRTVRVESAERAATISIRTGEIVFCEAEGLVGEAAFKEISTWSGGSFRMEPAEDETEENIRKPWEQLLIAAIRHRMDRGLAPDESGLFSGCMKGVDIVDLAQLFCVAMLHRVLHIDSGAIRGSIWFREGQPFHALCGDLEGEEAFCDLMLSQTGSFEAGTPEGEQPVTIEQPLESLFSRVDEIRGAAEEVVGRDEKLSLGAKVQRMKVSERIRAALSGDREMRSLLMRDNNRVIQLAVMSNPRLSESEVVLMAGNKQADEEVLRRISLNREWMRLHQVRLALVKNPKCPLPISTKLVQGLGPLDWKQIATSRSVPAVVAQMAKRLLSK